MRGRQLVGWLFIAAGLLSFLLKILPFAEWLEPLMRILLAWPGTILYMIGLGGILASTGGGYIWLTTLGIIVVYFVPGLLLLLRGRSDG